MISLGIRSLFRSYFLLKAREYRRAGFTNRKYYPSDTYGNEVAKLTLEFGNLMRAFAEAFK